MVNHIWNKCASCTCTLKKMLQVFRVGAQGKELIVKLAQSRNQINFEILHLKQKLLKKNILNENCSDK